MQLPPSGRLVSNLEKRLGDRLCGTADKGLRLETSAKEPAHSPKLGQIQPWPTIASVSSAPAVLEKCFFLAFLVWVF